MNSKDREEALKRPAFKNSFNIALLYLCGDYPTLQNVIDCERYQLETDDLIKIIRLGKHIVSVKDSLIDPTVLDFVVSKKIYHVSDPPPPLQFDKKGDLIFEEWPGFLIKEHKWTIGN